MNNIKLLLSVQEANMPLGLVSSKDLSSALQVMDCYSYHSSSSLENVAEGSTNFLLLKY